jgi:hypothetical protein
MSNKVFKRPTCSTCAYADMHRPLFSSCRARSPRENYGWPRIDADAWCAEHPDFHHYERALNAQQPKCPGCKYFKPTTSAVREHVAGFCELIAEDMWHTDSGCYLREEVTP